MQQHGKVAAVDDSTAPAGGDAANGVAAIVMRRSRPDFVALLCQADEHFAADAEFEGALAEALRGDPALVDLWQTWSDDQRWTPSAYLAGTEAGWFDGTRQYVKVHADRAGAAADFIHRLATWLARRTVLSPPG